MKVEAFIFKERDNSKERNC